MLAEQPDKVRALAALLTGPGPIRPADWLFVLVLLVLTAVLLLAVRLLWQMQRELTRSAGSLTCRPESSKNRLPRLPTNP
jgi:CBS-domain-containing membrane protein